jgi:hypothetical protein
MEQEAETTTASEADAAASSAKNTKVCKALS